MNASNLTKAAVLAVSVVWAAGCSTSGTSTSDSGSSSSTAGSGSTQGVNTGSGVSGSSMAGQQDVASLRTVFYFDFDKSVVKAEGMEDLKKHAAYIAANPAARVVLEGHADERGTREYNIALGERRAMAVARFLQVSGASAAKLETVSFGEEKPAILGHSESAWSQNRRVELKYVAR